MCSLKSSDTKASVEYECVVCYDPFRLNKTHTAQCQVCKKHICGMCFNNYTRHFKLKELGISTNSYNDTAYYHFNSVLCPHCKQLGVKISRDTVLRSDTHSCRMTQFMLRKYFLFNELIKHKDDYEAYIIIVDHIIKDLIQNYKMIKKHDKTSTKKILPSAIDSLEKIIEKDDSLSQLKHYLWIIKNK